MPPQPISSPRSLPLIVTLAVSLLLQGCAGYRMGPSNGLPAGSQSIQILPFQNATIEPRLVDPLTTAFRRQLQQDGTFKLATRREQADITVTGTILRYSRSGVSFQPDDILTVRDFQVALTARIVATQSSTGRVLLDREVGGRTTVRLRPDLPSTERQAIPLLAEDLARNATALLTDGDW